MRNGGETEFMTAARTRRWWSILSGRGVGLVAALAFALGLSFPSSVEATLIAHWSFDSNFSDGVGDFDGTGAVGGDQTIVTESIIGSGSLLLDGDGDFLDLSNALDLPIGPTDSTVAVWVKVPLAGTNGLGSSERVGVILGNYSGSPNSNWEFHEIGDPRLWWNDGELDYKGTPDLRDALWHHVAWVRDKSANEIRMYLDGNLTNTFTGAGSDVTFNDTFRIGGDRRDASGGPSFHGNIDDLRIYNDVLDQSAILALTVVPEPSTFALCLFTAAGLAVARRRRKRT